MSKYIKAEDILSLAERGVLISNSNYNKICKAIKSLPTIEIVRCKDCKFCEKHEDYSPTPIEPPWCYCKNPWVMRETGFNDFCSYGERIESGDE